MNVVRAFSVRAVTKKEKAVSPRDGLSVLGSERFLLFRLFLPRRRHPICSSFFEFPVIPPFSKNFASFHGRSQALFLGLFTEQLSDAREK